jgi:hypothetical protein
MSLGEFIQLVVAGWFFICMFTAWWLVKAETA